MAFYPSFNERRQRTILNLNASKTNNSIYGEDFSANLMLLTRASSPSFLNADKINLNTCWMVRHVCIVEFLATAAMQLRRF